MPKHWGYESVRSFFGSRIDQDKNEEFEPAKTVIEDSHKHDQSLYESYDHMTEELRKTADGKLCKDSSSFSDSDEEEILHGEHETAKIEELKEDFSVRVGNATEEGVDSRSQPGTQNEGSKQELEDLKREISTLSNELRYVEDVHRVTTQKLQSAEQLLSQKEEEKKVAEDTLKGMMFAYDDVKGQVSAEVDHMMTEMDAFYVEFEENFSVLKSRANEIAKKAKMRKDSDVLRSSMKEVKFW